MSGGVVLLIVNAVVAALFAACYFLIAYTQKSQRQVLPFGASYLAGMTTPLSELAIRVNANEFFMITSFAGMLAALLAMAAALALFERRSPAWRTITLLFVVGMCGRAATWGGHRDFVPYELAYQFPLALAALLCAVTAWRSSAERPFHRLLAILFSLTSLNFLAKPFVASAVGSGSTAADYAASRYALYSQGSSGILLTAAGLLILLIVIQTTSREYMEVSETDHLSGLLNRRGFERRAEAMLSPATAHADICLIMIDLDHFKAINDEYGHSTGDNVIQSFAQILQEEAPISALLARTGGEEFAVLFSRVQEDGALLVADAIRTATMGHMVSGLPTFTMSAGVVQREGAESLSDLMRRADFATYLAKTKGRNRVERHDTSRLENGSNIMPFGVAERRET